MDVSTRPSNKHRQGSAHMRRALAVFLLLPIVCMPVPAAPRAELADQETTQSIANNATHEVAITVVDPGKESISLAARLTNASVGVARDVAWQVRNETGELILDITANELSSPLPPGEYVIEAEYGAVAVRETVRLLEGNSIQVSFVLNAGGLRVLPTLKNLSSETLPQKTLVYALTGIEKGKLVAYSSQPGELLKLPSGLYRVESRIGIGNATAVADVRVRPGKMSAIEITHNVGLARFNYVGAPDAVVKWDIRPIDGQKLVSLDGISHQIPLKPGTYLAEAHVNDEILTAKFKIEPGVQRDIMLGN
jgi:hypothetical protein